MGICDPLYKRLLEDIIDDHVKDETYRETGAVGTALVLCESKNPESGVIQEYLERRRIATEMFEIDRMEQET